MTARNNLLEAEGVRIGPSGRVEMDRYRWHPEEA